MLHNLGATRSSLKPDHLLHTSDTFIRTPLPAAPGIEFIVHTAPQLRAGFTWMTAEFTPNATLPPPPPGIQRFLYALEGEFQMETGNRQLTPGSYAYLAPNSEQNIVSLTPARAAIIDKPYLAIPGEATPNDIIGQESNLPSEPLGGDPDLQVRRLMPDGPTWDFAVNTMTYAPGAALSQVEIHIMEHGLLMLQGGGIYRLGDSWYPVTAGDFIWMAPYCPQWFGALGKTPAKYLIYKDWYRHPLAN